MLITDFSTVNSQQIGQKLTVGGFAHTIRDHGGLIFIDLRSENEILQCVIDPERNKEAFKVTEEVHSEYVLKITGQLVKRSSETINPELPTGEVELEISELEIISKAKTLPFDIHAEPKNMAGEDIRLKYRYIDFRRPEMKTLMHKRHRFILDVRNWFNKENFIEVQTPILANSSPEGARDYLVPSRIQPGKFYALPQAPQQFKQLLMVGGFNKYFQIAPCFRDEDPRADRLVGDFYQVDAEVAWADEEYIYNLSNRLINEVFVNHTNKKLMDKEMVRIDYFEAMDKYGSDKPDMRYDLTWQDAKPVFKNSGFKVFADLCENDETRVQALVIPGAVDEFSRSDLDKIQAIGRNYGLPGIAYIQYFSDGAKSPIFKFFGETEAEIENKKQELEKFFQIKTGDLVLFVANKDKNLVWNAQGEMRKHIGSKLNLIDDSKLRYVWIENFPFFEKDEKTGKIDFGHNPFSLWQGGLEALTKAASEGQEALLKLKARQYDIAVNGSEVLSGGVRNPHPEALREAFKVVGYGQDEIQNQFGHMMEAYEYGAPQHAGFAWGVPRNLMILFGEENVRQVVPFPKNGSGVDPMTNAPSLVSQKQLKELGIEVG